MSNDQNIHFMVDPFSGNIAMVVPAPLIMFETADDFSSFVNMMQEALDTFRTESYTDRDSMAGIEKDYASKVIDSWQTELKNLPTDDGPQK